MMGLNVSITRGPEPPAFRVLAPNWTSGVISAGLNQTRLLDTVLLLWAPSALDMLGFPLCC